MSTPMNFVDRVGPPVSADWLNRVDRFMLGLPPSQILAMVTALEVRVAALEVQLASQAKVVDAAPSGTDVSAGRGASGPPDRA